MPRPTTTPDWASDANYPAGSEPWNGTPTRVEPDPADQARGFVPNVRGPAQWFNWILGLLRDWVEYLRDERDAHETRLDGHDTEIATHETRLDGHDTEIATHETRLDTLDAFVRTDLAASRGAYVHGLQAAPGWNALGPGPAWAPSVSGYMQRVEGGELMFAVAAGGPLPTLCTITGVRVFVQPGAARATSTDRVRVRAYRQAASGLGLSSIGSDVRDDGTTNLQVLDVGSFTPFNLSNDDSGAYGLTNLGIVIRVDAGLTADPDRVYFAEIRYEVGIR